MGKKTFASLENCTNLFAALTEFRRESGQEFKHVRKNKAYMVKGLFSTEKYFTRLLKEHDIDHNYIRYIKDVLHEDRLIPRDFTHWNDNMSVPTMEMSERILKEAVQKLSEYQGEWRKRKKAKETSSVCTNDLTPLEIEETEGYVLNPETGIWEEPIIPEDSVDYDPVTEEDDEVVLLGGQDADKEDSITQWFIDFAPLAERAKKLGIKFDIKCD